MEAIVEKEIKSYKRFQNLYWAFKNYKKDPLKYRHPKETCTPDTWNRWLEDDNLRFNVITGIEYDCFWRKYDRETLFRMINDSIWEIRLDDYFDKDRDFFHLNNLFFEMDGDIWKIYYEDDANDIFSLNLLFQNFPIRPECDNCCKEDFDEFESNSDLCYACYCCRYLCEFYEIQNSKIKYY